MERDEKPANERSKHKCERERSPQNDYQQNVSFSLFMLSLSPLSRKNRVGQTLKQFAGGLAEVVVKVPAFFPCDVGSLLCQVDNVLTQPRHSGRGDGCPVRVLLRGS
ncbi:hypothetical protein ACOMHN_002929 [Nucella lapillus]